MKTPKLSFNSFLYKTPKFSRVLKFERIRPYSSYMQPTKPIAIRYKTCATPMQHMTKTYTTLIETCSTMNEYIEASTTLAIRIS